MKHIPRKSNQRCLRCDHINFVKIRLNFWDILEKSVMHAVRWRLSFIFFGGGWGGTTGNDVVCGTWAWSPSHLLPSATRHKVVKSKFWVLHFTGANTLLQQQYCSSDSSCHTYKPFYNSLEILWSIVLQNKGILLGNKTLYLLGECNMILLIIFLHNGERHSIKAHTLAEERRNNRGMYWFFLSGVCFGHKGRFNESTCRVPQGKTIIQRQKMVSLNAIGQGWLGCTPRGVISIFRYSHCTGERLGPVSTVCALIHVTWEKAGGSAMFRRTNTSAHSVWFSSGLNHCCAHTLGSRLVWSRVTTNDNCGVSRLRTVSHPRLVQSYYACINRNKKC